MTTNLDVYTLARERRPGRGDLLIGGCGDPQTAEVGDKPPPKVALIMKSLANEFFVNMQRAAKRTR